MTQSIRVLHVDDDPEFGELTATILESEHDQLSVQTATTAVEGLDSISDRPPDCVVSDYDMPKQNGIEFLQRVREEWPELPFILFTGKGSEEVASEAISSGVTDYLQKGAGTEQYELLANRITNAVERRRTAREAERQQHLLSRGEILGSIGGWELDHETDTLRLTDGLKTLYGLDDDDGQHSLSEIIEIYDEESQAAIESVIDRATEEGYAETAHLQFERTDGERRIAEGNAELVENETEGTVLRGVVHDKTDQYERQRELTQIETLFQHAQDSLFLVDVGDEFTVERVNPAWEEATGLSADAVRGQPPRAVLGDEHGAAAERQYQRCVDERGPVEYEQQLELDGGLTCWETRIAPVVINGTAEYIAGSMRDVTESQKRQRELQILQQAIDDATVPITLADPAQADNPLVYVNDAYEEMTGYSAAESLGRNCRYLQGENTDPEKVAALREAIDDEEPITVELRNYRSDGTEFWNRLTVSPIFDDEGRLIRYLGTQRDITERKEREQRLEETQSLVADMERLADVGAWEYDPLTDELTNTAGTKRIYGVDPATELTLEDGFSFFQQENRSRLRERFEACLETGEPYELDVRVITTDGEEKWVTARGERVDESDPESPIRGYVQDITEQKRRGQELREVTSQYQALIDHFPGGGVFLLDEELRFVHAGGDNLEDAGLTSADFEGNRPRDLFPPRIADEQEQYLRKTFDGESHIYSQVYRGKHYEIRTMPIRDNAGEVSYAMSVSRNITQEVEQKQELERQNDQLEEFASVVSHDLRNPLNVAETRLELAQAETDSPHLDGAVDAIDRCQSLIDDLLTLARGGETVGDLESVSLARVAEECWDVIPADGATLEVETQGRVTADPARLQQLLENLLANAVEHGSDQPTVRVRDLPDGFCVVDDGPGIPEDERDDVFEAGYSTTEDGTGFGLRIVKQVVEAHGWEIQVTDSEDDGARVEVTGVQKESPVL